MPTEELFTCYEDPTSNITALLTAYPACGHLGLPGAITGSYTCTGPPGSCTNFPGGNFVLIKNNDQCIGIATYSNVNLPFYVLYQLCMTEYENGTRLGQLGFGPAASSQSSSCTNDTFIGSAIINYLGAQFTISITGA